jgi:hypothetical protein
VTLRQKSYEHSDTDDPEDATSWVVISTHEDLEKAERRLRLICGPPLYYDAEGKPVKPPMRAKPRWPMLTIDAPLGKVTKRL